MLAIQLFIGGWPLKGSGTFEHRAWIDTKVQDTNTSKSQQMNYCTYELAARDPTVPLSQGESFRLIVTESQHDMIVSVSKRIIKQLEQVSNARVINIILDVVFNSAWMPVVLGAKQIRLDNIPPYLESPAEKHSLVFAGGDAPSVPHVRTTRLHKVSTSNFTVPRGRAWDMNINKSTDAYEHENSSAKLQLSPTNKIGTPSRLNDSKVLAGSSRTKESTRSPEIPPPDFSKTIGGTEAEMMDAMFGSERISFQSTYGAGKANWNRDSDAGFEREGDGSENVFLQVLLKSKGETPIRRRPMSASINRVSSPKY